MGGGSSKPKAPKTTRKPKADGIEADQNEEWQSHAGCEGTRFELDPAISPHAICYHDRCGGKGRSLDDAAGDGPNYPLIGVGVLALALLIGGGLAYWFGCCCRRRRKSGKNTSAGGSTTSQLSKGKSIQSKRGSMKTLKSLKSKKSRKSSRTSKKSSAKNSMKSLRKSTKKSSRKSASKKMSGKSSKSKKKK